MGIVAAYAVPHPPLIVPAVGRGQERAIQDTVDAYREVARRIAAHAPDTIVVVSPHAPLFRDCFHVSTGEAGHGDMGRFGAWDASVTVPYDGAMGASIAACARKHTVPLCGSGMRDGELDHATFVPLHFVNEAYTGYEVVRIVRACRPRRISPWGAASPRRPTTSTAPACSSRAAICPTSWRPRVRTAMRRRDPCSTAR